MRSDTAPDQNIVTTPRKEDHDAVANIDGGTLGCARLLILIRYRVNDLPPGSVVTLSTHNPIAPIGVPAWCQITGHGWLGRTSETPPTYAARITDHPTRTSPASPWKVDR